MLLRPEQSQLERSGKAFVPSYYTNNSPATDAVRSPWRRVLLGWGGGWGGSRGTDWSSFILSVDLCFSFCPLNSLKGRGFSLSYNFGVPSVRPPRGPPVLRLLMLQIDGLWLAAATARPPLKIRQPGLSCWCVASVQVWQCTRTAEPGDPPTAPAPFNPHRFPALLLKGLKETEAWTWGQHR